MDLCPGLSGAGTKTFTIVFFGIAESWQQLRCASLEEWENVRDAQDRVLYGREKQWTSYMWRTWRVLLKRMCVCACSVVSDSLALHGLQPARLLCPWDFPARILGWFAISYSRGSSPPRCISCISHIGRQILYH